ncbi:hypothetical protein L1987_59224 [Smallanthus sonchifolius]|uniref:Uncharacterized protein n=1 Tax=Smallanthus sonchifolius TaxID=185202 RepID=A0ACB9D4X8_9ASTR|nr:hypothetical protein L1987_59224 [Smallanthus sonchifolius]
MDTTVLTKTVFNLISSFLIFWPATSSSSIIPPGVFLPDTALCINFRDKYYDEIHGRINFYGEIDLPPMATNMEEFENKMEIKIEGMRTMILERFSGVDQKLTAIEELLKKIVETQNHDKGNMVAIRGGDGGPSRESGPEKSCRAEISRGWLHLDDQGRQGLPWEAGNPHGWVGLYTHHYGKDSPQGTDFGRGKDFCGPAWVGQLESDENDTEKGWSSLGKTAVKTGQDENFKDSLKPDGLGRKESWVGSSGQVADKTDSGGGEEEEDHTGSRAACGNKKDDKTDASLQDSIKPDQWANKPLAQVASEGSNEKGHEESQKPGSCGSKEEGLGPKRKHPDSPVEGRNDSPMTATRQRLNIFTTDEQEILIEIEPIMQSIRRIMHEDGYNNGDPLSADDQTYILDNVFNHHPDKAKKLGAGVDYIMMSKYMNIKGSRCFYIVSTDGRKEDFSYHKCMKNFVRGKYPDKADKFIPKYFKNSEPPRSRNRDRGSGGPGAPRSWSGCDRETWDEARTRRPAWQQMRSHSAGTKQKRARWRQKAAH